MKIIRKKYISGISLLLCIFFFIFITITDFPYFHNLDADFNIWNIKTSVILEGEHHHEANPQSPLFDFHKIKIIDIGECPICQIFGNLRFIFSDLALNFCYKINCSSKYPQYSFLLSSNIYNVPLSRAPPLS